ncbi:MAG: GNAT family N-acetyltransferase [Pseudomonadota bacterium]
MADRLLIRRATPEDAPALSALAFRSKAHWGYSSEFMDACRGELTIGAQQLETRELHAFKALEGDELLGFYALEVLSSEACELDALFVAPEHMGRGVGRALLEHARVQAVSFSASVLVIQGDPHAAAFYEAAGARHVDDRASGSIAGRYLPLYELDTNSAHGVGNNKNAK